jgi:hypothetical protein
MNRCAVKRVVVMLLLLVLGGAIVNVAVAWGLVRIRVNSYQGTLLLIDLEASMRVHRHGEWRQEVLADGSFVVSHLSKAPLDVSEFSFHRVGFRFYGKHRRDLDFDRTIEVGWPKLSMSGSSNWIWQRLEFPVIASNLCRPLWPGFAINTIFYAAILWALWFAPGAVRRMIRRRRGQCPACAYPVSTSPVCTECGKSLSR